MNNGVRVVILVVFGIVGAWAGYWLGHLFGWSEDADWPRQIGGGSGAILLAIALSVAAVLIGALVLPKRR
jgi:uncharacterized membrane protein YeaQ/YmgE (transglycosylase-associated protein family)